MTSLVVRSTSPARRCAVCHDDLPSRGEISRWTCAGCGTTAHRACLPGLRRCPTLGCRRPLRAPAGDVATRARARVAEGGAGLGSLVVVAPGLLGALWPLLVGAAGALANGVAELFPLGLLLIVLSFACVAVLLAPFLLGVGVLAPMARARGLPGRHDLRAGASALVGSAVGMVWGLYALRSMLHF